MTVEKQEFDAYFDVSRETLERLDLYFGLLEKWNPKINLVSAATLSNSWKRHFVDSAQLWAEVPTSTKKLVDLGSGGGFPGLVLAAIAAEKAPELKITLIESDSRKAVFLQTVVRELSLSAAIVSNRIERAPPQNADIVTARALAALPKLLPLVLRHLAPSGRAILQKGTNYQAEVDQALENWSFTLQKKESVTEPSAKILTLTDLEPL